MDIGEVQKVWRVVPEPFPEQHPENVPEEQNPRSPVVLPEPVPV